MANESSGGSNTDTRATTADIKRLLGDTSDQVVSEILSLQPTLADLEKAAQWVAGDRDLDQADGQVLKGVSGEIVTLLAVEDDEQEPPADR
jgi:hypothetical protein